MGSPAFALSQPVQGHFLSVMSEDVIILFGHLQSLRPANERRCYFVKTSLIGWAQT